MGINGGGEVRGEFQSRVRITVKQTFTVPCVPKVRCPGLSLKVSFGFLCSSSFHADSAAPSRAMVKRAEKKNRVRRWCIYFPKENDKQVRSWKKTLRDVLSELKFPVWQFHDTAPHSADILRVGHAVSYDSAARIIRLATERDHTFRILGQPNGGAILCSHADAHTGPKL